MRNLHLQEYIDYLEVIQDSVFKILPLYEEKNIYLEDYVSDLYYEVMHVLDIIDIMPNGAWYPTTLTGLNFLLKTVNQENKHKIVRKKVLYMTNLIANHLSSIKE